jgi:N-acetylglucosamine malate deacetylase 2
MLHQPDVNLGTEQFGRVLIFVAHPDDETIACSGLLQRAADSLVVFAVDGAPPHYGFEKKFGSLQTYSDARFVEASRALSFVPRCSIRRLSRRDGTWFLDQHLFLELPEAFASLVQIAHEFSPDLLVSHAFEGGHLDHDACHILAKPTARALKLQSLEFPLYWRSPDGRDVFQQFRCSQEGEFALQLSQEEILVKRRMLSEYRSQQKLTSIFQLDPERYRGVMSADHTEPTWPEYPFENRRMPLRTDLFLRKVAEFHDADSSTL